MREQSKRPRTRLKIPATRTGYAERLAFATAAREKLRRQYNEMGRQFREKEITHEQWEQFQETFQQRSLAVSEQLNELKFDVPDDELNAVDQTRDFEQVAETTPDGV